MIQVDLPDVATAAASDPSSCNCPDSGGFGEKDISQLWRTGARNTVATLALPPILKDNRVDAFCSKPQPGTCPARLGLAPKLHVPQNATLTSSMRGKPFDTRIACPLLVTRMPSKQGLWRILMNAIHISWQNKLVQILVPLVTVLVICTTVMAQTGAAVPLRYGFEQGQTFAYRVNIQADRDDHEDILSGIISYDIKSASNDQIQVTYHGGLTRNKKNKPNANAGRGRPFGGPFGPGLNIPRPPSPFDRPSMTGTTQTTNQITMTPLGEIRSLEGTSQLPYLLGNLSIMLFEPLPAEPQNAWTVDSGVTISNKRERSGPPFFGPRGFPGSPFDREDPERRTTGSDNTSYAIKQADGDNVVVQKTYRLTSPVTDGRGYDINGSGTWTFNRKLGIPEALNFRQTLTVREGQTSTAIPVTITYNRMSEEEWQQHQEEQQKRMEEAKKRLEQIAKERAVKPLSEKDKDRVLEDLKSSNTARKISALQRLKGKKPPKGDREIARAIAPLRDDSNRMLSKMAKEAYEVWSKGVGSAPEEEMSASEEERADDSNPFVVESDRGMRSWSDLSGQFTVEAEFVEVKDNKVVLKRKDGQLLSVPLDRLSEKDQTVVKQLRK